MVWSRQIAALDRVVSGSQVSIHSGPLAIGQRRMYSRSGSATKSAQVGSLSLISARPSRWPGSTSQLSWISSMRRARAG
eukprot:3573885-Pyramimonas_sp.AAC.1